MNQITANDLLPHLKGVKAVGMSRWQALCPAHVDKNKSLSIGQAGEKLLLFCHAGCNFADILKACGVSATPGNRPPSRKIEKKMQEIVYPRFIGSMWAEWAYSTEDEAINALGVELGLSAVALRAVGCCNAWPHEAWGFPMYNHAGTFTGMRLRGKDGMKWSVPGGKEGMFMTYGISEPFCIVEGPTDLAALFDLGIAGLGRPNCSGACKDIVAYCRKNNIKPVIIADADAPGIEGAVELQKMIPGSKKWMLPAKDCRAFVNEGGTRDEFMAGLNSL